MNFLRHFIKKKEVAQPKNGDGNRGVLSVLREQAQPMPEVRRMLLRVNKIAVEELARESGVSVSTVYMTLRGERQNGRVVEKMSELLGVSKEALFPPAA